jgi:hypothetical protein
MTQDEMQRLLIRIVDEIECVIWYHELIQIALEQLRNPNDKTLHRIDLLLSSYSEYCDHHFDELRTCFRRMDGLNANLLIDS